MTDGGHVCDPVEQPYVTARGIRERHWLCSKCGLLLAVKSPPLGEYRSRCKGCSPDHDSICMRCNGVGYEPVEERP